MRARHLRLAALSVVVALGACSKKDDTPPGADATTGKEVLAALGIDTTLGARATRSGALMTDADNPFGTTVVNLRRTAEVFIVGAENTSATGDVSVQLLDPLDTTPPSAIALQATPTTLTVGTTGLSGESKMIKRPVAADLDGDGKDEVVSAVFEPTPKTIRLFTMDDGSTYNLAPGPATIAWKTAKTYSADVDFGVANAYPYEAPILGATRDWAHTIDLAAGDLDGDGKDEIVLTSEATLYVIGHDLRLVTERDFTTLTGATTQLLRVAVGDLDGDGKDEIVVANGTYDVNKTAEVSVFALAGSSLAQLLGGALAATASSTSIRSAAVAVGDIDGDGKPEAVLAGVKDSGGSVVTMALAFKVQSGVLLASFMSQTWSSALASDVQNLWAERTPAAVQAARELDGAIPILAIANLDDSKQPGDVAGNGVNEIVTGDDVIYLQAAGTATGSFAAFGSNGQGVLRAGLGTELLPGSNVAGWVVWGQRAPDTAYFDQAAAGDLNGDGKDELVLVDYLRTRLRQYYYDPTTKNLAKGPNVAISGVPCPYLVLADVDAASANSPVVRYVGHALVYSDPIILAVLSGPPYWDKTDSKGNAIQDTSQMQTTLGFSASASFGVGASVEISIGAWGGETAKVPVVANGEETVKTGVTTTYSAAFKVEVAGGVEVTYNAPAGADKVLFASVPVDVYEYVDVADPKKQFFVREQRKAETNFVDVDFYNAHNGDYADITPAALKNHVIGNPYSYPTLAQATSLHQSLPGFSYIIQQKIDEASQLVFPGVPQGNGYVSLQYSAEGTVGAEFSCSLEFTSEQEASFVALEGSSASMKFGLTVSGSLTAGTFVQGSVGGLAADYYSASGYRYNWGIFSYKQTPTSGNEYMVVNYWVDPK